MKESLSALLDGECSPDELDRLLAELERDPELARHFSRQCLARETRSGTRVRAADLDFSSRVIAALHAEPESAVLPFPSRPNRWSWRTAASLAAAAAVGAVAVLVVRPPPAATAPVAGPVPETVTTTTVAQEVDETPYDKLDDDNARQLRNYLIAYNRSRGQQGVGSTMGYARYTAYTGDRPDQKR